MPTVTEIKQAIDAIARVLDEHHDDVADDFYDLLRMVGAADQNAIIACGEYATEAEVNGA